MIETLIHNSTIYCIKRSLLSICDILHPCCLLLINVDNINETVELPDVLAVGTKVSELETLFTLGLVTVWTHTAGVVITADHTGGPQPPGRVL